MKVTTAAIQEVLQLLTATPRRLAAVSNGLNEEQLNDKPKAKSWSVNEILAHLRACADVWGKTIEAMLTEDNPTLPYLSPRTWVKKTDYPQRPFRESLLAFTAQRQALLETLHVLDVASWSRAAVIKGHAHTIFSQARRMAQHEQTHCEQLEALF